MEQTAIKHANKVACITSGRVPVAGRLGAEFSWSQINSASTQLAAALAELGVRKGDAVALILPNCVQFIVAFYAILKAGFSGSAPLCRPGKDQSIGVPFPDVECRIVSLDDERTDVGVGEVGK